MGAILPFTPKQSPSESAVEAAWVAYCGMVQRQIDCPELGSNLEHCMATARAYKVWCDLFLAEDAA